MMNVNALNKFNEIRNLPEDETIEFKEAKDNYDFNKLGEYFSAISNEANLKGLRCGWLVFGVHDKSRTIVGTNFRNDPVKIQSLKNEIAQKISNGITFSDIHELEVDGKRVLMFEIPAAPLGLPTAFEGHYYGRNGESCAALSLVKIEQIRNQRSFDWSAQLVPGATPKDLDSEALNKARFEFKKKNPDIEDEVNLWDDATFLNKAKLTIDGKITNACLILLGNQESVRFLQPAIAQMTWILKDADGLEIDYKHFFPPFLLSVDKLLSKIRNITFRYLPDNTLFPDEVMQYDNFVIREALHNCIAHQDYGLNERINVVETPDTLVFANGGSFLPKTVENVIEKDAPQRYYRNAFLCAAMVNLNMIDTIGSGIKRMYIYQKKRFFPLPDYTIKENSVTVKIYGKVINENYVRLLRKDANITLPLIIAIDKVQKRQPITDDMAKLLRKLKFIEGRKGNFYLSEKVAASLDDMATFVQNKAFDKQYYIDLTFKLIEKNNSKGTSKKKIVSLLYSKLSNVMTDTQKQNYIRNLLHSMVEHKIITSSNRLYFVYVDEN